MFPLPRRALRRSLLALGAMLSAIAGTQAMPAGPAVNVDLARYSGRWYVIACAPTPQPRPLGAYFEYKPRGDGRIDEAYTARGGSFDGAPVTVEHIASADPEHPGKWKVRKGWLRSDEQWVLYVSSDYRQAIAGAPDRAEAWILAREPVIPDWIFAGLLARVAMQGYDVSQIHRVAQKPEQLGQPGYPWRE